MTDHMDKQEMLLILGSRSLADMPDLVKAMHPDHAQALIDCAEGFAIWLLRVATYMNARVYLMQDHDHAVAAQNRVAKAVRKALGFSYPRQDITF